MNPGILIIQLHSTARRIHAMKSVMRLVMKITQLHSSKTQIRVVLTVLKWIAFKGSRKFVRK